jgi:hypothetical protein
MRNANTDGHTRAVAHCDNGHANADPYAYGHPDRHAHPDCNAVAVPYRYAHRHADGDTHRHADPDSPTVDDSQRT